VVYAHTGKLFRPQKNKKEFPSFAIAWMDLKDIILNEIRQAQKDK
jgi:hypothetical protein